jgi:UPF0755 protein
MKMVRVLGLLFLFSFGATIFFVHTILPGQSMGGVRVEIASGEDLGNIAEELQRKGIVRSAALFRVYLKYRGLDRHIKSGTFLVSPGSSFSELAELLMGAEGHEMVVTIPEGFTVAQIDERLASLGLTEAGDLLRCAEECDFSSFAFLPPPYPGGHGGRIEGYLFPDTYYISVPDFVPKFFAERLLGTFRSRVIEGFAVDLATSKRSLHELVTMASLIEREAKTDEERSVISGILWKRLDAGRGLDVDATVRYGLRKPSGELTKDDLQHRNAYNTRRHVGLPPGPIANPGLASIKAALHPQESEYWYYLHGKDGQVHYSKDNDEHNTKKARFL